MFASPDKKRKRMRTDSGKIDGHANRKNNWDNPDGLGWQLWLRNRTFGLSSESIQRQVGQFSSIGLLGLPSLADDIQKRWQINRKQGPYAFNSDLPFFSGRYSVPYTRNPAKYSQEYAQQISSPAAQSLPSNYYSQGFATVAPKTLTFSGHNILRKKIATKPVTHLNYKGNSPYKTKDSTKHQEGFYKTDDTTHLSIDNKNVPVFETPQLFPDKTSHKDASTTFETNETFPSSDLRQLPDNVRQNKITQDNRPTVKSIRNTPPAHARPTEAVFNRPSQKDIVQHILRRKPAPNILHSVSPNKTEERSPLYFAGLLKLSNPVDRNIPPLFFRPPIPRMTNYQQDAGTDTLSTRTSHYLVTKKEKQTPKPKTVMRKNSDSSDKTASNLPDQPQKDSVVESKKRTDPIRSAVPDLLSLNRSGNHTGFPTPSSALIFNKTMPSSGQTAQNPPSQKQLQTVKELTALQQHDSHAIAARLSPGQQGEQYLQKPLLSSRQTAHSLVPGKQSLTETALHPARQITNILAAGMSPTPYSGQNWNNNYLRYGTVQALSDPATKKTPTQQAVSQQPFPSFSYLALQLAGRVAESTMNKETSLGHSYHNADATDRSDDITKTHKELPAPLAPSVPSVSHILKSMAHSLHDRTSLSHSPMAITSPASAQSVLSFTKHRLYPKYSQTSLPVNGVSNKANALKLSATLSPEVLNHTEPQVTRSQRSQLSDKSSPNIIADMLRISHPPSFTLQRFQRAKSDITVQQQQGVNEDVKKITLPIKSPKMSSRLSLDGSVYPVDSWALYASTPKLSSSSKKQYSNSSSQGSVISRQPTFSPIQRNITKLKTANSFNVPHNLIVHQEPLTGTGAVENDHKVPRSPVLHVSGKHILLSKSAAIPSSIMDKSSSRGSLHIVESQKSRPFYPGGQKPFVQHLTNNTASNAATSRLFLKWSVPPIGDGDLSPQMIRVHSGNESSRETGLVGQDMPLAPTPSSQVRGHSLSNKASNSHVVQTSPLSLAEETSAAGVVGPPSTGTGVENKTPQLATGNTQAALDLDELVEKTWLKIMRKLTIERERRGHSKWI